LEFWRRMVWVGHGNPRLAQRKPDRKGRLRVGSAACEYAVSRRYELRDIAVAQADFLEKRHVGKMVLVPPPLC
jgi:hypothetical protein